MVHWRLLASFDIPKLTTRHDTDFILHRQRPLPLYNMSLYTFHFSLHGVMSAFVLCIMHLFLLFSIDGVIRAQRTASAALTPRYGVLHCILPCPMVKVYVLRVLHGWCFFSGYADSNGSHDELWGRCVCGVLYFHSQWMNG